jgi:hypothetical protein
MNLDWSLRTYNTLAFWLWPSLAFTCPGLSTCPGFWPFASPGLMPSGLPSGLRALGVPWTLLRFACPEAAVPAPQSRRRTAEGGGARRIARRVPIPESVRKERSGHWMWKKDFCCANFHMPQRNKEVVG